MSDESESTEEDALEIGGENEIPGEAGETSPPPARAIEEKPRYLTYNEAAKSLCMLGKNDSGLKYAYLMMNAVDKDLTDISVIPTFRNVIFVNVSGNRLTIEGLEVLLSMTYLLMLQADRNRVTSAAMEPMLYLQVLSLNRNNISETVGISHRLLECLELNYNKISVVSLNPYVLENLKVLELRGNLLSTTNGIFFPTLVCLYLAENRIDKIEGSETLVNLKILHMRDNKIANLDGFMPQCVKLNYVNLRQNQVRKVSEVRKLRCLANLEVMVISQNPVTGGSGGGEEEEETTYRVHMLVMLPNLKRINKDPVLDEEREEAAEMRQQMLEDGASFTELDAEREEDQDD